MTDTPIWRRLDEGSPEPAAPTPPRAPAEPLIRRFESADETPIRPTLEPPMPASAKGPVPRSRPWLLLWLVALGTFLVLSAGVWVIDLVERFGVLAAPLSAALALVLGGLVVWAIREALALRRLGQVSRVRERFAQEAAAAETQPALLASLAALEKTLPAAVASRGAALRAEGSRDRPVGDLAALYERVVVGPLDDLALVAVRRATVDIFFLMAVSPTRATDTVVFLARAIRMLRQVALAYGHRPSRLVLFRLAQRMLGDVTLISVVAVAAGELGRPLGQMVQRAGATLAEAGRNAADPLSGAAAMGGGALVVGAGTILSEASDVMAESAVAALRLSQLGLLAIRECRPLPLDKAQADALSAQLQAEIMRLRRTPNPRQHHS